MGQFLNKVAVVTGASKGIGAGIAKRLAAEGAAVVVNYSSSKVDADKVVAAIKEAGGNAIAVGGNVGKEDEVARLFEETKNVFCLGRVDVLVNNAGVFAIAPIDDISVSEFHRHFDTNVLGTLLATKAALPLFPAEGGSIVNIGSIVSTMAPPMAPIYIGSKGAIDSIVKALAKELAPRKIRVNGVNPGYVHTEGVTAAGMRGNEFEAQMIALTPLGRPGKPEDIAASVSFLASEEASWITGEVLVVSGGAGM